MDTLLDAVQKLKLEFMFNLPFKHFFKLFYKLALDIESILFSGKFTWKAIMPHLQLYPHFRGTLTLPKGFTGFRLYLKLEKPTTI